mmetsp:Transcript_30847/g.65175  ORF Transcript_30847/g.65175 Transcript_30847/m.65175 type:complete len:175 (+) Transcript_30847:1387-1911(+)
MLRSGGSDMHLLQWNMNCSAVTTRTIGRAHTYSHINGQQKSQFTANNCGIIVTSGISSMLFTLSSLSFSVDTGCQLQAFPDQDFLPFLPPAFRPLPHQSLVHSEYPSNHGPMPQMLLSLQALLLSQVSHPSLLEDSMLAQCDVVYRQVPSSSFLLHRLVYLPLQIVLLPRQEIQ